MISFFSKQTLTKILTAFCILLLSVYFVPRVFATGITVSNVAFDPATGSIAFDYSGDTLQGQQDISIYDTTGTTMYWDTNKPGNCSVSHCKGSLAVTSNSDSGVTSVKIQVDTDLSQTLNYPLPLPTTNAPQTPSAVGGWTSSGDTWVYASANSFTISGVDRTLVFSKGTRIKATNNSTTFYGTVASSSFSTNTTVTLIANSDYSLANSAITSPYYSYAANPDGYPTLFTYAPSATGFTGSVTYLDAKFATIGRQITVSLQFYGTSNSTSLTAQLPVARNPYSGDTMAWPALIINNTDFSVVLFRSYSMLVSEKNHVKTHKNQCVQAMLCSPECLSGATNRGQTMAPEAQKPSQ